MNYEKKKKGSFYETPCTNIICCSRNYLPLDSRCFRCNILCRLSSRPPSIC